MASDYDLFVIVPRFSDITKILTTRNTSVQTLISLEFLTNLEIVVIWRPFILRGLTHVNGIMLAGDQVISRALEQSRCLTVTGCCAEHIRLFSEPLITTLIKDSCRKQ